MKCSSIIPFLLMASHLNAQDANIPRGMESITSIHVPGGVEVVSYDNQTGKLYAIGSDSAMIFTMDMSAQLSLSWSQKYSNTEEWKPTSVAVDTAGRGFVACSWIPTPPDRVPGMVQIVDTATSKAVWQFSIGFHPDCIAFSPDGRYLVAANEGEQGQQDRAGAITIVDLKDIHSPADFAGFSDIQSYELKDENLAQGVTLDQLRIHPLLRETPSIDLEPEYLAPSNQGVWVSLQENNGLAYFDFALRKWTSVQTLGTISHVFDANDHDGVNISTEAGFEMLLQPDTISMATIDNHQYIVLANEGEKSDDDSIRFAQALSNGLIDTGTIANLLVQYPNDEFIKLGRVWISTIDGDLDGDGDIDTPTLFGARSVSIHAAHNGKMLWNSGSQFEQVSALLWPKQYNSDDSRSDRSGPEPEGIAIGHIEDRTLLFVGLERTDAIFMYDISDPSSPVLIDAKPIDIGCSRPEGLAFFTRSDRHFLAVASEVGGCLSIFEIIY